MIAAPAAFLVMLVSMMVTKIVGVYPVTKFYGSPGKEAAYTTLLMSTGLTFGTISALFGLSHQVIDRAQYSSLVAAVIGSAVVPTLIVNAFFLPRHVLHGTVTASAVTIEKSRPAIVEKRLKPKRNSRSKRHAK